MYIYYQNAVHQLRKNSLQSMQSDLLKKLLIMTVHLYYSLAIGCLPYTAWRETLVPVNLVKLTIDQKFAKFSLSKFLHIYRVLREY